MLRLPAAVLLSASLAWACSSSDAAVPTPGKSKDAGAHPHADASTMPTGTATSPDAAPRPDAADPAFCGAGSNTPPGTVCVTQVIGHAIDESGAPIAAGQLVSACGAQQCNPGFTDAAGDFTIPVGLRIAPGDYSVQVHKRVDFTAFYFRLPVDSKGPIVDMGDVRALPMPASGPELTVDRAGVPAQSVTSGDVTLEVPDNIYVRLDVESNLAENTTAGKGRAFRSLKIPGEFMKEYADPALGFSAMYALEPFECSFETPNPDPTVVNGTPANVRLSFANSAGIAAGSAVDLMALGTYIYPDWKTAAGDPVVPATFTKVAKGHVSADGKRIELDPGEGLLYLTWVAVRPTP